MSDDLDFPVFLFQQGVQTFVSIAGGVMACAGALYVLLELLCCRRVAQKHRRRELIRQGKEVRTDNMHV